MKKVQLLIAAADVARVRGQADKAMQYLQEALPIAERGNLRRLLAAIYTDLTSLSLERKQIPDAARYAGIALKLEVEAGDRYFLPSQFLTVARVQRSGGNLTEALECLVTRRTSWTAYCANVSSAGKSIVFVSLGVFNLRLSVRARRRQWGRRRLRLPSY